MTFEELKDKALSLPLEPGVYLMQDKSGQIIYVGKGEEAQKPREPVFPEHCRAYAEDKKNGQPDRPF